MMKSIRGRETEKIFTCQRSRTLPPDSRQIARHQLRVLDNACSPAMVKFLLPTVWNISRWTV